MFWITRGRGLRPKAERAAGFGGGATPGASPAALRAADGGLSRTGESGVHRPAKARGLRSGCSDSRRAAYAPPRAAIFFGDLKHRTLIPTVNLSKGQPQIFKTAHHEDFVRDWKEKIVDVALATSAAPTYFPLAAIGDELFADGGLYANSPDFLAMHEAEHFLKIDPSQISILSIGTTTSKFSFAHGGSTKLGILGWARGQRLVQTSISSQQHRRHYCAPQAWR